MTSYLHKPKVCYRRLLDRGTKSFYSASFLHQIDQLEVSMLNELIIKSHCTMLITSVFYPIIYRNPAPHRTCSSTSLGVLYFRWLCQPNHNTHGNVQCIGNLLRVIQQVANPYPPSIYGLIHPSLPGSHSSGSAYAVVVFKWHESEPYGIHLCLLH